MSDSDLIVTNKLLSSLISISGQNLLPYLEEVSLVGEQVLHEPKEAIAEVYFPQTARTSLLLAMSDRSATEILSVGNEGMMGMPAILGSNSPTTRSIVQISGTAIKLPAKVIQREFQQNKAIRQLLLIYAQAQFSHVAQIVACRSHHDIEQRLARWLLLVYESTQQDKLPLTQKFISLMLGVRRASITETAISFQKQGIIQYSRGQIAIVDYSKLKSVSCECYEKIKFEYTRLLEPKLLKED